MMTIKGEWERISSFFECDCGCHAVHVSVLRIENQDKPDAVSLSFWKHGKDQGYSLRWRLRYIWDIIRYGEPHLDGVWLNNRTARKMGKLLVELSEQLADYEPPCEREEGGSR